MKTKMFLCAIFALLVTFVSPSFASAENPTATAYFSSDKNYVYYDTVVVLDSATVTYVQKVEYLNGGYEMREAAYEILAAFSNRMVYSYYVSYEDLEGELQVKGPDHIYNARKNDVVVVKVEISPEGSKITEFVADLSNR